MALSITTSEENGGVFVEVEGEIDVSNAAELRSALDEALKSAVYDIEIDFSKVSYIDSTGIGVLVGFSHRANAARIAFRISNTQPSVLRVLRLLGVEDELNARED